MKLAPTTSKANRRWIQALDVDVSWSVPRLMRIPFRVDVPYTRRSVGGHQPFPSAERRVYGTRAIPNRSGFSLFELIIVLAVIITVTAIAAPNMMERVRSGRVQDAAEHVREILAAARNYAIDTGVDYHFRFEVGGHNVVAIPADQNQSMGNSSDSDSETSELFYRSGELSATIFLWNGRDDKSGSETLKSLAFGNLPNAGDLASKTWSNPILFRFDGSAEDKTFRVMDEQQRSCDVTVRGLTGAISVSGVFIMEEK